VTTYTPTPFFCGNCGKKLHFMERGWPIPGSWFVHSDDRRFHCNGRLFFGPCTHTKGLKW
jgi:hypothetical protein